MNAAETRDNIPLENEQLELLVASIVEVTKQRERTALEDCFGRIVMRLTDAKILTIYHLQPKEGEIFVVPVLQLAGGVNVSTRSANVKPFLLSSKSAFFNSLRIFSRNFKGIFFSVEILLIRTGPLP